MEFFLLEGAETRLRARSPEQEAEIAELKRAASGRVALVPGYGSTIAAVVSTVLFRDALELLVRASAIDRGADMETFDSRVELERLCEVEPGAPTGWKNVLHVLAAREPLALDRTPLIELRESGAALDATTRWLLRSTDTRSVANIRWLRRGRFAAVGLLIMLALVVKLVDAFSTPNVALGKAVSLSSLALQSPPGAALVDGIESGRHPPSSKKADFVVTNQQPQPFALIDLGRTYSIKEIRVFNRADDNFDDGLPYTVELSNDGSVYVPLDVRSTHFGSGILDRPWSIDGRHTAARFVRVRCVKQLALSEVEVFGK